MPTWRVEQLIKRSGFGAGTQQFEELAEALPGFFFFDRITAADFAEGLDLFFVFFGYALELVAGVSEGTAAVAEFLELEDGIADATKHGDQMEGLVGFEVGAEEALGEAGGDDLEA